MATAVVMQKHEFALLRDLVADRFGLYYTDETAYLLERRLAARVDALGLRSFLDYHDYLVNPGLPERERDDELSELFDRLSTRETYFFREHYQLKAMAEELLPRLARSRAHDKRLRLWSAGCSSGEEVYSLAITILESGLFEREAGWDVQIVGTDLSVRALETARQGSYGRASFRETDDAMLARYFRRQADGTWAIADDVRRRCSVLFTRANLSRPDRDWVAFDTQGQDLLSGPFDAIFCRNLLIYFQRPRRTGLIVGLARRMASDAVLFLGHSETLHELKTPLVLDRLGGEQVYRLASQSSAAAVRAVDADVNHSVRQGGR